MNSFKCKFTFSSRKKFVIGFFFIALSFFISRWGIWKLFMFPLIFSDGFEYLEIAEQINRGIKPSFDIIGGGYPLIIWVTRIISNSGYGIIVFQQLFSLFTILFLFFTFYRVKNLFLPVLLFSVLYLSFDNVLKWEIAIFPDSIISNGLLMLIPLSFRLLNSNNNVYPITISFVSFYLIFIRSSSIFLLVYVLLLIVLLMKRKNFTKTVILSSSLFVLISLLSSYNWIYSIGNRFTPLTYGRIKNHNYSDSAQNISQKSDSEKLATLANSILLNLPHNSYLWKYHFSWTPKEITEGVINCRFGTKIIYKNSKLFFYSKGNKADSTGILIPLNSAKLSPEKVYEKLKNYPFDINNFSNKIRFFYAFQHNIYYDAYGKTYYGFIKNAYSTSVLRNNEFVNFMDSTKGNRVLKYGLGNLINNRSDDFNQRILKLYESKLFKLYDFAQNNLEDKLLRNYFWVYLSLFSVIFSFVRSSINKQINCVDLIVLGSFFIHLGSSLIFSFVVPNPLPRYTFNTEFFFYLTGVIAIFEIIGFSILSFFALRKRKLHLK
jgi:hypothetical protein